MKKQYEKPTLAVEYYQLTQAIAACVTKLVFWTALVSRTIAMRQTR